MTEGQFILFQCLLLIVIPIITFILNKFFGKFFEKKGENLATKQDIEDITKKIKSVEKIFTDQSDAYKASLNLSTQHKLNIKKMEIETIFSFNDKLSTWTLNLLRYNIFFYRFNNFKSIKNDCNNLARLKSDIHFSESNLELFISDDGFFEAKNNLIERLRAYESLLFEKAKILNSALEEYDEDYNSSNIYQNYEEANDEFMDSVNNYLSDFREANTGILDAANKTCSDLFKIYKGVTLSLIKKIDEKN